MDWNTLFNVVLERKLDANYHLGHIILECFKKKRPDDIAEINGATDEKETYVSLFNRTVRLARSLTNFGCRPGDVIALAGTNHLDLAVPFFAGMINGLPICGIDPAFKYVEIKSVIETSKPKIAFCDDNTTKENYTKIAEELGIDLTVITFLNGDLTMQKFIEKFDDNTPIDDFKPPSFDPTEIYAWLINTSGTTGVAKLVAVTQTNVLAALLRVLRGTEYTHHGNQRITFVLSPVQWISSFITRFGCLLLRIIILSTTKYTSESGDIDHVIDLIEKYKPQINAGSPSIWASIMEKDRPCDLTCFRHINVFGAKIYKDMVDSLKKRIHPDAIIFETYGQAEAIGTIFISTPGVSPLGSCGKMTTGILAKLVDEHGKEITEPHIFGELLYNGPMFHETAKAFTEDGWLRTGDLFYRDENDNYFFVERLKMIIKYRTYHVIPTDLEGIIREHPGVLDVCVTSIDHLTDQQWPVAVVVRRPGADVTAQEIKDIVAENLSDVKKLRGGVIFVDKLPLTPTRKLARMAIRTIAATSKRE